MGAYPNVMLELGYAFSSLGYERVVLVCNTAYASPSYDLKVGG